MTVVNISIFVPYYNNKIGLKRLLDSVGQASDVEVIIINDHSESVVDLIEQYDSINIKYLEQVDGKRWAGAARNLGLSQAAGKFVMFADADDFLCTDWYLKVRKYFQADFDVVYFSPEATVIGSNSLAKRHLGYRELVNKYLTSDDQIIRYRFHVPWSKLIRRSLISSNNLSFDEVIASNDVIFSLKVGFHAYKITADYNSIYCVTESAGSLTKQSTETVLDSRFDVMARFNDFLIEKNKTEYLGAMSGHLKNALKFGMSKFFYRFFYCRYMGYPIFYSFSHIIHVIKRELFNK